MTGGFQASCKSHSLPPHNLGSPTSQTCLRQSAQFPSSYTLTELSLTPRCFPPPPTVLCSPGLPDQHLQLQRHPKDQEDAECALFSPALG